MSQGSPINVTVDQGVNLKILRALQKQGYVFLHQVHDLEQIFKSVIPQGKPFILGGSALGGPDMLVSKKFKQVESIIGAGNKKDILHLYSAYQNKSQYFITDNPDDFIYHKKREKLEKILALKIRRTIEFVEEIKKY